MPRAKVYVQNERVSRFNDLRQNIECSRSTDNLIRDVIIEMKHIFETCNKSMSGNLRKLSESLKINNLISEHKMFVIKSLIQYITYMQDYIHTIVQNFTKMNERFYYEYQVEYEKKVDIQVDTLAPLLSKIREQNINLEEMIQIYKMKFNQAEIIQKQFEEQIQKKSDSVNVKNDNNGEYFQELKIKVINSKWVVEEETEKIQKIHDSLTNHEKEFDNAFITLCKSLVLIEKEKSNKLITFFKDLIESTFFLPLYCEKKENFVNSVIEGTEKLSKNVISENLQTCLTIVETMQYPVFSVDIVHTKYECIKPMKMSIIKSKEDEDMEISKIISYFLGSFDKNVKGTYFYNIEFLKQKAIQKDLLQRLYKTVKDTHKTDIIIDDKPFFLMLEILTIISKNIIQKNSHSKSVESIYELCYVIVRIKLRFTEEKGKVYLADYMNLSLALEDEILWRSIYELMLNDKKHVSENAKIFQKIWGNFNVFMGNGPISVDKTQIAKLEILERLVKMQERLNIRLAFAFNFSAKIGQMYGIREFDMIYLLQRIEKYNSTDKLMSLQPFCNSLRERKKISLKFEGLMCIYYAIPYLDADDPKFTEILYVSKQWFQKFRKMLAKEFLSQKKLNLQIKQRIKVWDSFLPPNKYDYKQLWLEYNNSPKSKNQETLEGIIFMDVQRSKKPKMNFDPAIIVELCSVYAYNDKDISYCQGLNYIMGFLYFIYRDKAKTFNVFSYVVDTMLRKVLAKDMKNMELAFYQLERLLDLSSKDFSEFLYVNDLHSNLYASSWIITLFTSSFDYTHDQILFLVWDQIILNKWKGFFSFSLCLLKSQKKQIMSCDFDEAMKILNNYYSWPALTDSEYQQKFLESFLTFSSKNKITGEIIKALAEEFNKIKQKISKAIIKTTEKK